MSVGLDTPRRDRVPRSRRHSTCSSDVARSSARDSADSRVSTQARETLLARRRGGHVGGDPRHRGGVLTGVAVPVGLGLDEDAEVGAGEEHAVPLGALVHGRLTEVPLAPSRRRIGDTSCSPCPEGTPHPHTSAVTAPRPSGPQQPPATSTRPGLSRSPTAAVPTTRRSRGWRTRWRPSRTPSSSATPTSRPTCTSPATASCWPSTTPCSTGSPTARAASPTARTPRCRSALIGGREPVPTLAELFDAFPDVRFNIDLKSEGAVEALAAFIDEREAWDRVLVGSFSGRRMNAFRRRTAGRVATSAHPLEVVAFVLSPSGRLARLLTRGRPRRTADPAPPGPARGGLARARPTRPRGRRPGARLDHRRPDRDERPPRSWCRRHHDRSHRHTQGRAPRPRTVERPEGPTWS